MENDPKFEQRSDEIQDIISRIPSGLVRYGSAVLLLVITVFVFVSWLIKYPDLLKAEVVITTKPAPVSLVTRVLGQLSLESG